MKRLFSFIFLLVSLGLALISTDASANTYRVTTIAYDHGDISPAYFQYQFPAGAIFTLNMFPQQGYAVDRVMINTVPVSANDYLGNSLTVVVNTDLVIEVFFKSSTPTYLITYTSGGNGTITTDEGVELSKTVRRFNEGDNACFTIDPDDDYEIDQLLVDDMLVNPIVNPYCFENINDDHSIEVTFKAIPKEHYLEITISIRDEAGNTTTGTSTTNPPPGINPVLEGAEPVVYFNNSPYPYFVVDTVIVNNVVVYAGPGGVPPTEYKFGAFTGDSSIHVVFVRDIGIPSIEIPSLSISPNPVNGIATITKDADVIFTHIDVVDIMGNVLINIENPNNTIDFTALAKGNYIVRFHTAKGFAVRSIIRN